MIELQPLISELVVITSRRCLTNNLSHFRLLRPTTSTAKQTVKHCPQGWQGREGKTGTLREISHPAGNWVARMTSNKLRQVGASPGNAQVSGMMFEIWPFKNSTSSEVARWWNDDNYTKFSMRDILVVVMMMMIMKMIVRQPEKLAFRYPNIN